MQTLDHDGNGPPVLTLPSLRLFIPPLRLVSAAMLQVVQTGDVQEFGLLEEFISTVTDMVPELLNPDQKAQLLLGLRSRVVLDLCRPGQITDTETEIAIEMHLERIRTLISTWASQPCFADVEFPESNFVNQIESFLKDPEEREKFFQETFPVDFGPEYDDALQMLMLDFLSRLERLIPIPDLQQTASMLAAVPSAMEECVKSVPDPRQLKDVLRFHTRLGHLDVIDEAQTIPTSFGNCILSALSLPQLEKVLIDADHIELQTTPEHIHTVTVQVEGETVTLLQNMLQIEEPEGDEQDSVKSEVQGGSVIGEGDDGPGEEDETDHDTPQSLKPASFQPLKQSRRLQLKRQALNEKKDENASRKRQRQKFSNDKTCPDCGKTFLRATAMRRHQETHSSNRQLKYKCPDCNKRFRDHYDMTRHSMRVHNREDVVSDAEAEAEVEVEVVEASTSDTPDSKNCYLCGKYFARRVDMKRHMKSHSEERPYKCAYCGKSFKHLYVLKRHQKEICKSKDLQINLLGNGTEASDVSLEGITDGKICPICSRILPCSADMTKHLRSHTEERPFICVTCEKGFKYKDTLKKHQLIHGHEGIREEESKSVEQILAEADPGGPDQKDSGLDTPVTTLGENPPAKIEQVAKKAAKIHVCPVCARAFDNVKPLNKHMQCHTEDRPYHCVHCKRRFKHVHGLKRHQIYAICHKKIVRFSLKKGQKRGTTKAGLSNDQGTTSKIPVWCSNCGTHFEYLKDLKEHQENVCKVEDKDNMKCDDCEKDFKSMTMLKIHQRIHNALYCKECGKILASEPAFERHKLMHKPIQCTMCDKTFTLLRRLREHYEKLHSFTGPYPCPQCEKTFNQLSYLAVHERVHNGDYPYACDMCPDKFRSSNCLTVHQRKHTGERPFLCWQCGKCYRSASELSVHMHTHSEERPWACTQCDLAYRTKLQLTNHVEGVHIGVRYPCSTCGKQFVKEISLKRHELIHTGERPYPCNECGKTFLTANELRLHTRYHTGERPYKCDVCSKAFIQSGYLKSHKRIHTGEKPFKCDICDKAFRLSYHMKKHRRTHTGKPKSHVCEECGLAFTHKKSLCEHSLTHQVKITEVRIQFE